MKYVLVILFMFGGIKLFAQRKITKKTGYHYIGKLDSAKRNCLMPYSLDKAYNTVPSKAFKVVQAFYSSSTIWDESRIILVDGIRFYCFP